MSDSKALPGDTGSQEIITSVRAVYILTRYWIILTGDNRRHPLQPLLSDMPPCSAAGIL